MFNVKGIATFCDIKRYQVAKLTTNRITNVIVCLQRVNTQSALVCALVILYPYEIIMHAHYTRSYSAIDITNHIVCNR